MLNNNKNLMVEKIKVTMIFKYVPDFGFNLALNFTK